MAATVLSRHRKWLVLVTAVAAFASAVIACEIGLRGYHWAMSHRRASVTKEIVLDAKLGWRATENYEFKGDLVDHSRRPYRAEVFTDHLGFRVFGDPSVTDRQKVLFLGDSFTHAVQVSAEDGYYSIVGDTLGFEVFAYGAGGFGTLQELMVLREFLRLIEPDAVVLQLCTNDLYNNHYGLEFGSAWSNNGLLRPYWENDGIEYRLPRSFPRLRLFAAERSEFLYFLFSRFDRITAGRERFGTEQRVAEEGLEFALFAEAVEVTGRLLSMVRHAAPAQTPVFAFCSDDREHEHEALQAASERAGLMFIGGVPAALRRAEQRGVCTRAADGGHWNIQGHRVVAEVLMSRLTLNKDSVTPEPFDQAF